MKESYITPEVIIIELMTEQAVFNVSTQNSPLLRPGEDF